MDNDQGKQGHEAKRIPLHPAARVSTFDQPSLMPLKLLSACSNRGKK
nr:hypothetical protein Q903MT_gene2360 [Picea sitchensis]